MSKYPELAGKPMKGVLPDMASPLSIDAEKGDRCVPANDMGDVASSITRGKGFPDPLNLVDVIE